MKNVVVGILYKIINGAKLYLLISATKDFGENTGKLYPVGGHIENNESEVDALKRESFEELGIDIVPIKKIAESLGDVPDQLTHWWLCDQINHNIKLQVDEKEIKEVRWLTKEEIISNPEIFWPATYLFFVNKFFKVKP